MDYETKFGLRKEHSYDEVVRYIQADPTKIKFPDRSALFLSKHQIYGQVRDAMRNWGAEGQAAQMAYQSGEQPAPFVPPRPRPMQPGAPQDPPPPPGDDDDELMGPPPPAPGQRYADLLQPGPDGTAEGLGAEGVQPPPPPPPPPPPSAPSAAQQAGSAFASAASSAAGNVVGQAAGNAAVQGLARAAAAAGFGAAAGAEGGPPGVMLGAAAGVVGSLGASLLGQALGGGSGGGGFSAPAPNAPPAGSVSGFRPQGQPINQAMINRQEQAHNRGAAPQAFVGSTRDMNGLNQGHRPRDRKPKRTMAAAPTEDDPSMRRGILGGQASSSTGPFVPAALSNPGAMPASAEPAPPAAPSYGDLVSRIKSAPVIGSSRPRERSPPRADRRPLSVQRGEASLFPAGDRRERRVGREVPAAVPAAVPAPRRPQHVSFRDPATKRKATEDIYSRKKRPNPATSKTIGAKRKADGPAQDDRPRRKPPPKPNGRLNRPSGSGLGGRGGMYGSL